MSSAGTAERDRDSEENSNGTKNKKQKNISQSNVLREMSEENEWNVVEGAEKMLKNRCGRTQTHSNIPKKKT